MISRYQNLYQFMSINNLNLRFFFNIQGKSDFYATTKKLQDYLARNLSLDG